MRVAVRGLLRAPVLALTIVATVGLGIGATTAIFAAIDAALLRPLPYAAPDRLVRIYTDAPPNKFPLLRRRLPRAAGAADAFRAGGGYTDRPMPSATAPSRSGCAAALCRATYFSLLGITPALGPRLHGGGRPAGQSAAGHRQRMRSGSSVSAARATRSARPSGSTASTTRSCGVLPPRLGPLERGQDFFVAAQWDSRRGARARSSSSAIGRLRGRPTRGGRGRRAARRSTGALFPLWQGSYQDEKATWGVMDLKTHIVGDFGSVAGLALGAVALVWLIACANASNLLIARVTSRRRELAVRSALGASRPRVVRYLLAESALLAVGAALLGVGLAWIGISLARTAGAAYIPRAPEIVARVAGRWPSSSASRCSARCCSASSPRFTAPADRWTRRCGPWAARRPAASPCGGFAASWWLPVRHRHAAPRRRGSAAREPEQSRARRSRVRHAQRADRRGDAAAGAIRR